MARFLSSAVDKFRSDMLEHYLNSYFNHTGSDTVILIRKDAAFGTRHVSSMTVKKDCILIKFASPDAENVHGSVCPSNDSLGDEVSQNRVVRNPFHESGESLPVFRLDTSDDDYRGYQGSGEISEDSNDYCEPLVHDKLLHGETLGALSIDTGSGVVRYNHTMSNDLLRIYTPESASD